MLKDHLNSSRRKFIQNSSVLFVGLPFLKISDFNFDDIPVLQHNVPEIILADRRLKLSFDEERMVLNDGLQPSMLCTKKNTLIVQSQNSKKPLPQKRISYPFAMSTVVSRNGGKSWDEFPLKEGDNGVDMEGGIIQLKDGTILALETYVTPGI
jgi:hypothetical protein